MKKKLELLWNLSEYQNRLLSLFFIVLFYIIFAESYRFFYPSDSIIPDLKNLLSALKWAFTWNNGIDAIPIGLDFLYSIFRLIASLAIIIVIALIFTIIIHLLPKKIAQINYLLIDAIAQIPPIALLPLLLLWGGFGEVSKLLLLFLGLFPHFTLQILIQYKESETKYATQLKLLGIQEWQRVFFVYLPSLLKPVIEQIKLLIAPAWLFLLVAETYGTQAGLGYRLFFFKKFLQVDAIIIYVIFIAIISISLFEVFKILLAKLEREPSEKHYS